MPTIVNPQLLCAIQVGFLSKTQKSVGARAPMAPTLNTPLLSSSNWSRDMTKHKNAIISKFPDFERKIRQILQNSKNWKNDIFMFIDVSPKIFELQRRTIPHFKAWNKLIWPFVIHFSTKSDISWSAEQNTCPIFFAPDFI